MMKHHEEEDTHARVDGLLKRFDEARAAEQARAQQEQAKTEADALLKDARAKRRSENRLAKLDKLERERKELDAARTERQAAWLVQYRANVTQSDGFGVTCGKCGHVGNFDDFTTDKLGFERPRSVFQCPACSFAIRREAKAGFIQLTPIQATL